MNVINRSRWISKMAEDKDANSFKPFYKETTAERALLSLASVAQDNYVRYDDDSLFSRDEPLIKVGSLEKYLDPFDMSVEDFTAYLNKVHERDYRELPKNEAPLLRPNEMI